MKKVAHQGDSSLANDDISQRLTGLIGSLHEIRGSSLLKRLDSATRKIEQLDIAETAGRVESTAGLSVNLRGLGSIAAVGDRVSLTSPGRPDILLEVLGFKPGIISAMAFGFLDGVGSQSHVRCSVRSPAQNESARCGLLPCDGWLGRVIDPLGNPVDMKGQLPVGRTRHHTQAQAPDATTRGRLGTRLDLGVAALDLFTTCRAGQRLGLFAGSGIGKSTLLAMLACNTDCDVVVLALVGERGREVREFIEDDLGPEGLARSIVVVATSDTPPLIRREAAYTAVTVAEHFRDQGKSVLLLMDSVTRFCLALREIGLSIGEPPATRGYPPSVFTALPRLLERAGPGPVVNGKVGQITAVFTVLVEGDDHNEPIADAVRGILDGHVVLERRIADTGRFPAIDVLRSLSRTVPGCLEPDERASVARARAILSLHAEVADLVRLGAYKAGSDAKIDEAVQLAPKIETVLRQARNHRSDFATSFRDLAAALEL